MTGVNDLVDDGEVGYTIHVGPVTSSDENTGVDPADVSVINTDNDTAGVRSSGRRNADDRGRRHGVHRGARYSQSCGHHRRPVGQHRWKELARPHC